jgi:hypothetical protein
MTGLGRLLVFGFLVAGGACGFGFYNDSGNPVPGTDYWGWKCADGSAPPPDAGCLPQACDDSSTPALTDGGVCVCADGTDVLPSSCSEGGS